MSLVVPAVLPSSRKELEEKLALFSTFPAVSRVQIDVVDGKFASPASWPCAAPMEMREMVASGKMLPELDRIEYEIDLMCLDPEQAADAWLALGAVRLTFHAESVSDLPQLLARTREQYGHFISFGLALNIGSDLALLEQALGIVDYVQFMGIAKIGRQGQPFDRRVFEKIRAFHSRHRDMPLQVDGGVAFSNARQLSALGVGALIVGSGILKTSDPAAAMAAFEALQTPFGV